MSQVEMFFVGGHGILTPDGGVGIYAGEAPLLKDHLRVGVELAVSKEGVLFLTGGMTREEAGQVSEAKSYADVAEYCGWFGHSKPPVCIPEEYAKDSLQNLVFSLALFRDTYGYYPKTTAVGWEFKEERFVLHAASVEVWLRAKGISLPSGWFEYVGVNNPRGWARRRAVAGEQQKLVDVKQDPLLLGKQWQKQRDDRNPFGRQHSYAAVLRGELPDPDVLSGVKPSKP